MTTTDRLVTDLSALVPGQAIRVTIRKRNPVPPLTADGLEVRVYRVSTADAGGITYTPVPGAGGPDRFWFGWGYKPNRLGRPFGWQTVEVIGVA